MNQLMRRLLTVLAACAVLTGCATLTPAQQTTLADYQAFAHRVTQHYGKPDVQIMVGDSNAYGNAGTVSVMRQDGWMILSPTNLEPSVKYPGCRECRDFGFAHELGHWILGRFGCGAPCELEANAEAVKILVVGRPSVWTERAAFNHSVGYLWSIKEMQDKGRPVTKGHLPACQEIADLVAHYPAYGGRTC